MILSPVILGHGRAGEAIARSFSVVSQLHPELNLEAPQFLERGTEFSQLVRDSGGKDRHLILALAQPHALRSRSLIAANEAGIKMIFSEKPLCTDLKDKETLLKISSKVAVFHGYRQMWAIQKMKTLLDAGELGEIISIEGKYWQSSAAQKALDGPSLLPDWKNDISLAGPSDVLLDLGTHWADLMIFLMGDAPIRTKSWLSYTNAEASHRDTHIYLIQEFSKNRKALGSVSKTVHGAKNDLEIFVIGSKRSFSWNFLNPDQIIIGRGREISTLTRTKEVYGTGQSAFHALGWLEGYIEIVKQGLFDFTGRPTLGYPNLQSSLQVCESLLNAEKI